MSEGEEIKSEGKPVLLKTDKAPCGCSLSTYSDGTNSLDACVGCALERAGNYLAEAGSKIRNNQMAANAMREQMLRQQVAQQLEREKRQS